MKYATIKTCDTGPNSSKTGKVGIKNRIKIIASSALLLTATSATAGPVYLAVGGQYIAPEAAPVLIGGLGVDRFRIQTVGLSGEWTIEYDDLPPGSDVPASAQAVLPFTQDLELEIDLAEGTVSGHAIKQLDAPAKVIIATMDVTGHASCLPRNGLACGQLVVDLELRGVLTDPNDPASVGRLSGETLGSLVWDETVAGYWTAMSANTTIGGNEGIINSLSWIDFNPDGS